MKNTLSIFFLVFLLSTTDIDEATEFNFDWTANLQITINFTPNEGNDNSAFSFNQTSTNQQMFIHAKLEHNNINGIIRIFGRVPGDRNRFCSCFLGHGISFCGSVEEGIPTGICWRGLVGGAWLYGNVNDVGEFTGNNIAYIYPDLKTVLLGWFINGTMVTS